MHISNTTQKRCNPFAPYTDESGTTYPRMPEHLYQEIPDPTPPEDYSDETYYRTEQDDAPYVIYTKKSDEQIAQVKQAKINQQSRAYLLETDWMVTRFAETGTPIPDDVKAKRQSARDAIVELPANAG